VSTEKRPAHAALTTDNAIAARTALAAGHGGRLTLPGRLAEEVGYLDDDGEPLIVLCGDGPTPRGAACLLVGLGARQRVVLGGQLQPYEPGARDLVEVLGCHAACFAAALHHGPVQFVRLAVDAIRVEDGARSSSVSCAAYAAAEPDLWGAFAATVAQHLDHDHGDVLVQLARLHLPAQQVVAAGVAELRREGLTLDVVTPEGATRIGLPLQTILDDPHELCGRLIELTAPSATRDRPLDDR
jgi:hypothetical protein